MPIKSLPPNPSLDHLKYQARDLFTALTQGNAEACARAREFREKFAKMTDDQIRHAKPSLADAQLIVAREYGFRSWAKLKHHVESFAKTSTSTMASPAPFQPPTGPVELKLKWPLGTRIVRETDAKQSSEMHFPGWLSPGIPGPAKQELFLASQYAYAVAKELPGDGREVELQHLDFQLESNLEGYPWRYDSGQTSEEDQSEIARFFNTLLRARVRYFLDTNNKVERTEGVDELMNRLNVYEGAKLKPGMTWDNQELDKMLNRMLSIKPPNSATALALRLRFDENYFKEMMDPFFLPDKAVQPGDTWTCSREWRKNKWKLLNLSLMREYRITFQSWETRVDQLCARLDFRGIEKTIPQAESEANRYSNPIIEGTFSGVLWFDPELGREIESNTKHDFDVTYKRPYVLHVKPAIVTDHHHQVVTTKLVSEL